MDELFEKMIYRALNQKATDIHMLLKKDLRIQFRIFGELKLYDILENEKGYKLMNFIKYKSLIHTNYRLMPQTGNISLKMNQKKYFLRVSYLPSLEFESIVIRILNNHELRSIQELTYQKEIQDYLYWLSKQSHGLFFISGATGSGKSTLIQHLNGILKPSSGDIYINDFKITDPDLNLTEIRKRVGVVFQYPEYQLFEETIEKDIAFGPSNLGLEEEEIKNRVKLSMEAVGLDYELFKDKSPFELSGGQKRRVAIAGVIAMNPEVLILDEPTAGLDPGGRDEIFELITKLHENNNMTIILSSHSMDDMAKLAKNIIVMNHGKIEFMGSPREVFNSNVDRLKEIGLDVPQVLELAIKLREKGFNIREDILTIEEAKEEILKAVKGGKQC